MKTPTIDRKQDLVNRAKPYFHTGLYLPEKKSYVKGLLHEPTGLRSYQGNLEPVIDHEGLFDLDRSAAWVTVNQYNALVLNTSNMLIADVDFGDQRLSRYAGAKNCEEVVKHLSELHLLDRDLHPLDEFRSAGDFRFADQSYRVYRTHSGCRVICASICVPWEELAWTAERFLRFLRSDPEYIRLCRIQKCYRARLTPKPWRETDNADCVCFRFSTEGKKAEVAPELAAQIALHDEMTLPDHQWAELA